MAEMYNLNLNQQFVNLSIFLYNEKFLVLLSALFEKSLIKFLATQLKNLAEIKFFRSWPFVHKPTSIWLSLLPSIYKDLSMILQKSRRCDGEVRKQFMRFLDNFISSKTCQQWTIIRNVYSEGRVKPPRLISSKKSEDLCSIELSSSRGSKFHQ